MTLYEFNILELNERMEAVNQYGAFLDNHMTQIEKCNCYAIDKCFAEVVYDAEYKTNNLFILYTGLPELLCSKSSFKIGSVSCSPDAILYGTNNKQFTSGNDGNNK